MTKRYPDTAIQDALWAWCGHVTDAAAAIGMNRGAFYERLHDLGIDGGQLRELRETGLLNLSGTSGLSEYVPTPGTVRQVQPVQDSLLVRMHSGDLPPNLRGNVSAETQGASMAGHRLRWSPKPARATTIAFEQAVLDLARAGKDTTKDALLDAIAESAQFQAFVEELVSLYRQKGREEKG